MQRVEICAHWRGDRAAMARRVGGHADTRKRPTEVHVAVPLQRGDAAKVNSGANPTPS